MLIYLNSKYTNMFSKLFKAIFFIIILLDSNIYAQGIVIGTTTYDNQTTAGAKHRLITTPDSTISAVWTGSTSLATTFTDRGTFYNHYNGIGWDAIPTSRVEGAKSISGELLLVDDHEVLISSDGVKLKVYKNSSIGATDWSQTSGSNDINGTSPMSYCPASTNDIYVINVGPGAIPALQFSRSLDGGQNWDVLAYEIPYLTTADGISTILGEYYKIGVYGSDVYIIYGASNTDLKLLYSYGSGEAGTWSEMIINDFPIDNYTGGLGQSTDINGDGIADTITTTDGAHELLLAYDGQAYFFSSAIQIYDDDPAVAGWDYIPTTSKLMFWKVGLPGLQEIAINVDWNNADGLNDPFKGIGANYSAYGAEGFASMPSAGIDAGTGRIYVAFVMPVEYTDPLGDPTLPSAQSRHDIFGIYTDDLGFTWSSPINLTYSAHLGYENVFPSLADQTFDGKIHMLWQRDAEPGSVTDSPADDIHVNDIMYLGLTSDRFEPYNPVASFDLSLTDIGGAFEAIFTNTSVDAETYLWTFDDGAISNEMDVTHTYAHGVYNACLTASNVYGSSTNCQMILAVNDPLADFSHTGDPAVNFTDLSSGGITSWSWNFGDGGTSTLPNPSYTFTENGEFTVCLSASNPIGTNSICKTVIVNALIPFATYTYVGDPTIIFTDMSTQSPDTWNWNFGDGGISTDQNPTHIFLSNGLYNVCLTVGNVAGSNTTCQNLNIAGYATTVANFIKTGDPIVLFTDLSTNSPATWFWDFDDGEISLEQNPTHTYTSNGTYNVCLTATGPGGGDTYCSYINIASAEPAPIAEFIYDFAFTNTWNFFDQSSNTPTDWLWEFGDGTISGLQNPIHTFPFAGVYNVCLTAYNGIGGNTICKDVNISNSIISLTSIEILIAPNPASDILHISTSLAEQLEFIQFIDMLGNKIQVPMQQIENNTTAADVRNLPEGNYLIQIENNKHVAGVIVQIQH